MGTRIMGVRSQRQRHPPPHPFNPPLGGICEALVVFGMEAPVPVGDRAISHLCSETSLCIPG